MHHLIRYILAAAIALQVSGCDRLEVSEQTDPVEAESVAQALQLRKLEREFGDDRRVPSATNISGVWTSRTGRNVQLEQRGETIVCRGYEFGCLISSAYEVTIAREPQFSASPDPAIPSAIR